VVKVLSSLYSKTAKFEEGYFLHVINGHPTGHLLTAVFNDFLSRLIAVVAAYEFGFKTPVDIYRCMCENVITVHNGDDAIVAFRKGVTEYYQSDYIQALKKAADSLGATLQLQSEESCNILDCVYLSCVTHCFRSDDRVYMLRKRSNPSRLIAALELTRNPNRSLNYELGVRASMYADLIFFPNLKRIVDNDICLILAQDPSLRETDHFKSIPTIYDIADLNNIDYHVLSKHLEDIGVLLVPPFLEMGQYSGNVVQDIVQSLGLESVTKA